MQLCILILCSITLPPLFNFIFIFKFSFLLPIHLTFWVVWIRCCFVPRLSAEWSALVEHAIYFHCILSTPFALLSLNTKIFLKWDFEVSISADPSFINTPHIIQWTIWTLGIENLCVVLWYYWSFSFIPADIHCYHM